MEKSQDLNHSAQQAPAQNQVQNTQAWVAPKCVVLGVGLTMGGQSGGSDGQGGFS